MHARRKCQTSWQLIPHLAIKKGKFNKSAESHVKNIWLHQEKMIKMIKCLTLISMRDGSCSHPKHLTTHTANISALKTTGFICVWVVAIGCLRVMFYEAKVPNSDGYVRLQKNSHAMEHHRQSKIFIRTFWVYIFE